MIFEARHCWYCLKYSEPQYQGDPSGSYLDLVNSDKFFVEATDSTDALEKAFNHILSHPQKFSFQNKYLILYKPADYFKKHLFKTPPKDPVCDYHWIEVKPVTVIS